jgi:DHA3 family macrolide efflux protein-like MFS transporter
MTISGITNPIVNGPLGAILQASVKPEMQGRVMGVVMSLATIMTPLSLAFAGPVSDVIGIRTWYWVAGIATLLMGIGGFFTPIIMNVEQNRNESSPPLPLQASTD